MPRDTPLEAVAARLAPHLGAARTAALPRHWQRLGDVLVLRGVTACFGADANRVAGAYAEVLDARLVLEADGVAGALREPRMRRLWGEGSAETTFVQDGIRYTLDAERIMFSAGNLAERQRMGRLDARGETVLDLFAGIGYFTLPLLVKSGAARVVACELNPLAARYLRSNAAVNGVADRLEVREGDSRAVAPRAVAERVVLGYFPGGHRFLDVAFAALRPEGGMLHYHDTARADRPYAELLAHVEEAARRAGRGPLAQTVRVVKSHSPGVVHAVMDVSVAPVGSWGGVPAAVPEAAR